jgi:hypothetical protein
MNRVEAQRILTRTKARILQIETAIDAVAVGDVSSYTLDTGQTKQTVTKSNLRLFEQLLDSLYNRQAVMQSRVTGDGVTHARSAR